MLYGFESIRSNNLKETLELLKKKRKIKILAGGTDLIVKMKDSNLDINYLLDISEIKELKGIKVLKTGIKIGALTTINEVVSHPIIWSKFNALHEGIKNLGSLQTRNMATLGGNIVNGSPAGDSLPGLYLYDAKLEIKSLEGKRIVKIGDFIKGVGKVDLKKGEILTNIILNFKDGKSAYERVKGRAAVAISKVSSALFLKSSDGKIEDLKITLGAVGPTIINVKGLTKFIGKKLDNSTIDKIAQLAFDSATPIDDIRSNREYRKQMCKVLTKKLINRLSN